MNLSLVRVENLETTFYLKSGPFRAVNNISYEIDKGETLGIVGESGCGKSVTSFSLMRLIERPGKITRGKFLLGDRDILTATESQMEEIRGGDMAMIFQEPMTALNPVLTIGFQIDEQIIKHKKCSHKEARDRSIEMLKLVGIPSPESRYSNYPHQLSGGMKQRVMIAMALACAPQLLIADEPTTALDVTTQAQVLQQLRDLQQATQVSILLITHDLGVAAQVCDRVAVMYCGEIVEIAAAAELFAAPRHPYTQGLLASVPVIRAERQERLQAMRGSLPEILPAGCRFAPRCPKAQSRCHAERPTLQNWDGSAAGQVACFFPVGP